MITEISINIFFKFKSAQKGKLQIKNTISFKSLTIIYSVALFVAAFIQGIVMISEYKVAYVMHFNVTFVLIMMLLSFTLSHGDARDYFKQKTMNFKEETIWYFQNKFKLLKKDEDRIAVEVDQFNQPLPVVNNEVYVIDLEEY